jgi:8-oxo-dGTP diphosphatase
VWDLPGGHVEEGESPEQALLRELHEELGVRGTPRFGGLVSRLENRELHLMIHVVRHWEGTPVNRARDEHDQIRWFNAAQIPHLPMGHAALPAIIEDALRSN